MLTRLILIVTLLLLGGCGDGKSTSKSAEAARIEREVTRRVEVVKKDLKVRQNRMRTIRTTAFILLAGGSIALLVRLQRQHGLHPTPTRLLPVTKWLDHYAIPSSARVIETQAPKHPTRKNRNPKRRKNPRHASKNYP